MEVTVIRLLIITSVSFVSAKHVHVQTSTSWTSAQEYCRLHHTELSPLTNQVEEQVFRDATGNQNGWIGLYRSTTGWKWSGGDDATYFNWNCRFTSYISYYNYIYSHSDGWCASSNYNSKSFFCLNLIVVEVKKTWEAARNHCSDNHIQLSSVLSETERLLAMREIKERQITDPVWIGLRYLGNTWFWVNGNPLEYMAWSPGSNEHQCPQQNRCGALNNNGQWESRDCSESLSFICY